MTTPHYADDQVTIYHGDCLNVLAELADNSVDAVVTDPPYDLTSGKRGGSGVASVNLESPYGRSRIGTGNGGGFMGQAWDSTGIAFDPETWRLCLRVLKPGGHLLAFGGTRTWHRLACAIEDAGFEIRDSIAWLYGSGFPKSLDVSKAIDKAARGVPQGAADPTSPNHGKYRSQATEGKRWDGDSGQGYGAGGSRFLADGKANISVTERAASGAAEIAPNAQHWAGWGTALKPAFEPIVVARKPLAGTVANNVLAYGTGALNIDATRVATDDTLTGSGTPPLQYGGANSRPFHADATPRGCSQHTAGRWPTNVVLDDSQAAELDKTGHGGIADSGGASRFFVRCDFPTFYYTAKAPRTERPTADGIAHPTVKPLGLMRWLVRLVTPPNGLVLDCFAGTGTTAEACIHEHKRAIVIERGASYLPLIVARLHKPMQVGFNFGEGADDD